MKVCIMRNDFGPQALRVFVTDLNVNPNILISTANERQIWVTEFMRPKFSTTIALAQQQISKPVNAREGMSTHVGIQITLGSLRRCRNL